MKSNKQILWVLGIIPMTALYFAAQHLNSEFHLVHIPFDDLIPFIPAFIIPYWSWFIYFPLLLFVAVAAEKEKALGNALFFFGGLLTAILILFLYPTMVDLRPEIIGDGFFGFLCRVTYAADAPVNAFPSIHCYDALMLHLLVFRGGKLGKNKPLHIASAVICAAICLSTVFVKQHSVVDIFGGCLLAAGLFIIKQIFFKEKQYAEGKSV